MRVLSDQIGRVMLIGAVLSVFVLLLSQPACRAEEPAVVAPSATQSADDPVSTEELAQAGETNESGPDDPVVAKAKSLFTKLSGQVVTPAMHEPMVTLTAELLYDRQQLLISLRNEIGALFGLSYGELASMPTTLDYESQQNRQELTTWIREGLKQEISTEQQEALNTAMKTFVQTHEQMTSSHKARLNLEFQLPDQEAGDFLSNFP